jgi:cytochrome c oxidase subunit II
MVPSNLNRLTSGRNWLTATAASLIGMAVVASSALAGAGNPTPGQTTLQEPVTEVAVAIVSFYNIVNVVIIAITVFVLFLMIYVMIRFNAKSNPVPTRTTHNAMLEVAWTLVPILILVGISVPSFRLLYLEYAYPKPDVTIKAIGNAWFWEHEYPDAGVKVTSNMVGDEDLLKAKFGKEEFDKRYSKLDGLVKQRLMQADAAPLWAQSNGKQIRQLTVDNEIAVPVNKVVHVLITSNDVIHGWAIPSFGVRAQAVPGRIVATWFKATQTGVYYGQCAVLCGEAHSGMPVTVRVVTDAAYADWLAAAKAKDWKKARGVLQAAADTETNEPKKFAIGPEVSPAATQPVTR